MGAITVTSGCSLSVVLLSLVVVINATSELLDADLEYYEETNSDQSPASISNFTSCLHEGNVTRGLGTCVCREVKVADHHHVFNKHVSCRQKKAFVHFLYCLTYNEFSNDSSSEIVVGRCLLPHVSILGDEYTLDALKEGRPCSKLNRNGTLCGKCSTNHSLAINSFEFMCISQDQCQDIHWFLHFVETLGPLTVFFCIILIFKLRGVSTGHANVFLLYAQTVSLPINILAIKRDWTLALKECYHNPYGCNNNTVPGILSKAILQIYGMWNLDVLSGIFPAICTRTDLGILNLFLLQYITAVYPLVLIAIAYLLIQLHARNFRPVVVLWKPFYKVLAPCRRTLDSKSTVIDTFATFTLLSYTKFVHASIVLLSPTYLYNISGENVGMVLLFDGSREYFKPPHTYYAIAAIVVLIVFVIPPPLILLLYPMQWFQRCLNTFRLRNNLLTAFTDAYLGCYKDGLNGTKDCRYFAGLYFIIRIIVFSLYAFVTNYNHLYLSLHIIIAVILVLHNILRPYRIDFFNKQDSILLNHFILITTVAMISNFKIELQKEHFVFEIFFYILILMPAGYMVGYIFIRLLTVACFKKCKLSNAQGSSRRLNNIVTRAFSSTGLRLASPVEDGLPDRMLRPGDYGATANSPVT